MFVVIISGTTIHQYYTDLHIEKTCLGKPTECFHCYYKIVLYFMQGTTVAQFMYLLAIYCDLSYKNRQKSSLSDIYPG